MGHARLTNVDYSKEWPSYLREVAQATKAKPTADAPILIEMSAKGAENSLEKLILTQSITELIDNYDEQLAELYLSQNAHLYRANTSVQKSSISAYLKEHYAATEQWKMGSWVYYPWTGRLIHILDRQRFNELRTIRNRDLITKEEQVVLSNFNVACLGMSVGSSSALALTLSGISDHIKLADGAVISGSNLNRILTGVTSIGKEKATVIMRQLYEMNPYVNVYAAPGKVTQASIQTLFESPWPINIVIDEIDDLEIKIRLRIEARKRGIPVLMATELGDSIMLDVERYDLDRNQPLFHGLIKDVEAIIDKKDMTQRQWMKYATSIIDPDNVPLNMQQSLLKIGTTVVTHPQLGATAMMTGGVLAFAVKQIALGKPFPSMREVISLEKSLVKDQRSRKQRRIHKRHTKVLKRSLEAM